MKNLMITLILALVSYTTFSQSSIQVEKKGEGEALLFLPGFTTPGSVWNETIDNLKDSYISYTVSYAGFNVIKPIGTPWYAPIKDDLIAYIKKENLSNVVIVGHSMGGNLAIDIAHELPEHISGLVLVESIPCMRELMMPGVSADDLQYDSPYNKQTIEMPEEAFKQMAAGMAQNMTVNESKMEDLTQWVVNADRETYVYGYTDLLKLDLRDKLSDIHINALILGASFPDKEVIRANYEKQYTNLKSKKIEVADNSKHFIMFDEPVWFYDQLNGYLSTNE